MHCHIWSFNTIWFCLAAFFPFSLFLPHIFSWMFHYYFFVLYCFVFSSNFHHSFGVGGSGRTVVVVMSSCSFSIYICEIWMLFISFISLCSCSRDWGATCPFSDDWKNKKKTRQTHSHIKKRPKWNENAWIFHSMHDMFAYMMTKFLEPESLCHLYRIGSIPLIWQRIIFSCNLLFAISREEKHLHQQYQPNTIHKI